jgi:hypothetical protein
LNRLETVKKNNKFLKCPLNGGVNRNELIAPGSLKADSKVLLGAGEKACFYPHPPQGGLYNLLYFNKSSPRLRVAASVEQGWGIYGCSIEKGLFQHPIMDFDF